MSTGGGKIDYQALLKEGYLRLKAMRDRLDAVERARCEPIAIVGIGCRFPGGGDGPGNFWRMLSEGVDATRDVPADRWDVDAYYDPDPDSPGRMYVKRGAFLDHVDRFDAGFFGISPRECASLDPQQRLLLEVAWEAIEDAGISRDSLSGRPAGVYVGTMFHDYAHLVASAGLQHVDTYFGTGNGIAFLAGRLSHYLGLQGPSLVLDTACSSSLVAVHLACQSLRAGETELALACGVNLILSPLSSVVMCRLRALAPDGRCKTFDASADGYARGEGCGVVVLKRLSDAIAAGDHVWATVRGSAVNQDGAGAGITVPNGLAQQAVIRKAMAEAKVEPGQVGYFEAHGTGTRLGDPLELRSLWAALKDGRDASRPVVVGSLKTNVGHMEGAAGIGALIKTALALNNGQIPPHLHVRQINPLIADERISLRIPSELMPWPQTGGPRLAGVSSFGMSGTNAHLILEAPNECCARAPQASEPPHTLCISARTEPELRELAARYRDHLRSAANQRFADVCYTAAVGRTHFAHRLSVNAADAEECARKLTEWIDGNGQPDGDAACDLTRYERGQYAKVSLPTYPFNRQRYWADLPETAPKLQRQDVLYKITWHYRQLNDQQQRSGRDFVLVGDGAGFGAQLAREIEQHGDRCRQVRSSGELDGLRTDGRPLEVVYLDGLDGDGKLKFESLANADQIVRLMTLARKVASIAGARLWVVTRGVHAIASAREVCRPAGASLWGLGKVFGLEHPECWGGLIDLPGDATPDQATCVVAEIYGSDGEDQIAYRAGRRYVARLEPAQVAVPQTPIAFDPQGVYWITGGLGAVGLQTAEWLVRSGARCLVMQGRRGLSADDRESDARRAGVRKLESLGAQVHVLTADVADAGFLPKARELLQALNRPLHAIFHAAGVSGLRPLAEMTADELRTVLAPKVAGLWNLHELTRDFPAANIVCFSSIASAWGSHSLAHYAAANQFMDSFVQYRRAQGLAGLSINWGPLRGGGMDLARQEERLARIGIRSLSVADFGAILGTLLRSDVSSMVAADVDWSVFKPVYEAQRHRPLLDLIATADAEHTQPVQRVARLDAKGVESFLLSQVATVLKTSAADLDVTEPMTALGVDSLMAMEVQKRVQTQLGVSVPVSDFLQGSSIRQMAAKVAANLDSNASAPPAEAEPQVVEGEL